MRWDFRDDLIRSPNRHGLGVKHNCIILTLLFDLILHVYTGNV